MRINDEDLESRQQIQRNSRSNAQAKVKALIKKSQYRAYVNSGMSPMEAAKKVGVKGLKFWKFYKPGEVEKRIEEQLEGKE